MKTFHVISAPESLPDWIIAQRLARLMEQKYSGDISEYQFKQKADALLRRADKP